MTTRHIELEKIIGDGRVLVLNMAMEATEIVTWGKAAELIWNNKAYTLVTRSDGKKLCSPSVEWEWPVVVVLTKYVSRHRKMFTLDAMVSKTSIRVRDKYVCAYCGEYGNTVDHIMPASRGGANTWGNLVTACKSCNGAKRDRTPEEAGMIAPRIKAGYGSNSRLEAAESLVYEVLAEYTQPD